MDILLKDLKHGCRVHAKHKGFSLVAVLTLALGIGASTAVFGVVNTILLKPLPFPDSARIVMPWFAAPIAPGFSSDRVPWSKQEFEIFRQQSKAFQSLGAFQGDTFNFTGGGEPERLDGIRASAGFFPALGVNPTIGRIFSADEDQPGSEHEVVLSDQLWRTRFNGDAHILGQAIRLNGYLYVVIGVMPPDFSFPRAEQMPETLDFHHVPQLWVPLAIPPSPQGPQDIAVIGRLKPSVNAAQVQVELDVLAKRLESLFPEGKGWFNCHAIPLAKQVMGDTRRPLILLLAAVGVVLLIACSNVANLLLTRSIARTREFSMRSALGAENSRLLRQLLTESLLLAAAGGLAGIILAAAAVHFVKTFGPTSLPRLAEVELDPYVFLFSILVTFGTGILFGLAPALGAASTDLSAALRQGIQRSGSGVAGSKMRNALLVTEVGLALVLVVAAGLLIRTFHSMLGSESGFRAERVLTFEFSLPASRYPNPDSMARVYSAILPALQSAPGVRSAGLISYLPMGGAPDSSGLRIPEHPAKTEKDQPFANYSFISRNTFSALGASLLSGRAFEDTDTLAALPVTIVNQAMARKYWPGENPVGKQVGVADTSWPVRTIIGVVANIKHSSLREDVAPEMFVPFTQNEIKVWPPMQTMQFAVRTYGDPKLVASGLSAAVSTVDPSLPLASLSTLSAMVDRSLTQQRFAMLLLGSFAALAMMLACIGLYGVISYSVAQRTREIGIRMALGATRTDIFQMVLSQGGRLVGSGIGLGLLAAFGATRLMAGFLYGVGPTDPFTFSAVPILLLAVAFFASILPASRATRVNPITALRFD